MRRARAGIILGGIGLLGAACASLSGLSGGSSVDGATDGGSEGATTDAAPSDPCHHAGLPRAPAVDDDPTASVPPLVVAIRTVVVNGGVDGGAAPGIDLDGVCTCFPDNTTAYGGKPSCVAPTGGGQACDGEGGADRQLDDVVAGYPEFFGARLPETGGPTMLLEITKYNGRANDADVFVAVFPSQGIYDNAGCKAPEAGAPPYAPAWTGCDRWTLDAQYVLPGTVEPRAYLHGYVTDHVLVVPSTDKPVTFVAGNAALTVSTAFLSARLVAVGPDLVPLAPPPASGMLFRMEEGILGGRVGTTDALRGLAASQSVVDGGPLCGFDSLFTTVKTTFLCPNADIMQSPSKDFISAPCDAISLVVAFAAQPAQLGAVRAPTKTGCADPNDPRFDMLFDCTK